MSKKVLYSIGGKPMTQENLALCAENARKVHLRAAKTRAAKHASAALQAAKAAKAAVAKAMACATV